MKRLLILAALLAACAKSATAPVGPQGLDPTVLFINQGGGVNSGNRPATMVWYDQSGQTQTNVIAFGATSCIHFTATLVTDSVRFVMVLGDTLLGPRGTVAMDSPWFDPKTGLVKPGNVLSDTAIKRIYPYGAEFWTFNLGVFTNWVVTNPAAPC